MKNIYLSALLVFAFLQFISCTDQITNSCDTGIKDFEGTFAEVQAQVLTPYCVGCHGNTQPSANLNLTSGNAFASLVNHTSLASDLFLVKPGDTGQSYLMKRLKAEDGESPMPPAGKLSQDLIDLVALWIEKGANEN